MTPTSALRPMAPLLAFHLRVGVRVALRAAAPVMALLVAAIGLSPEPARWPAEMGRALLLPRVDPLLPVLALASAMALAVWARRVLGLSPGSWLRHLPAGEAAHRRAGILGLAAAQLPLGLALALLWLGPRLAGEPVPVVTALSWGAASLAAAAAAWSLRARAWLAAAAAAGAYLGFGGTASGGAVALVAVLAVDLLGGSVARRGAPAPRRLLPASWPLELVITARALGRGMLTAQVAPLVLLGAAFLGAANNAASPRLASLILRLGSTLALALLAAGLAHLMAVRRPPWPWARSLPRPARTRIVLDGLVVGGLGVPLIVLTAWRDPLAAAGTAALLPGLAVLAAREIRGEGASRSLIPVRIFAVGLALGLLHALLPWSPLGAAALLPLQLGEAASRERRARVTSWREAGYLESGDPLSWSGG